jgi:peroxiredoxin
MTSPSPIADRVAECSPVLAARRSDRANKVLATERAWLAGRGLPAGTAKPGTVLPDAKLLDVHGVPTMLEAVAGSGTSVLVFYRGSWCPYCNIALSVYQAELLPRLEDRGVRLIAISPEKPDDSLTVQQKNELAFTVVSDPGNSLAGRLGIVMQHVEEVVQVAREDLGVDLAARNADGTLDVPMPATVILDGRRTVRWIDVHPDYSTRTEPKQVIDALDSLGL